MKYTRKIQCHHAILVIQVFLDNINYYIRYLPKVCCKNNTINKSLPRSF